MIHMAPLNKITFLTGNLKLLSDSKNTPARPTWDERTICFLGELSKNLMNDPKSRRFEDIMSYAFWIRNASLRQIKEHYYHNSDQKIGRGVAFHIAPSNVPINFAVSFTSCLLAGNINVIRLSNKPFEQVDIVLENLKKTFANGFQDMEKYLILIRYEHDEDITQYLSSICDIRIIWGGNKTIDLVRTAHLPPRAIELPFADRHSLALLNSEAVLKSDIKRLASDFYVDTYYTDQNACSSPRIIIWFGNKIEEAKELFWSAVEELVDDKYEYKAIFSIDKYDRFCCLSAIDDNVFLVNSNNKVMRIQVNTLEEKIMDYKYGGGYFFEYDAKDISEIAPIVNKSCQTLSYYGIKADYIQQFVVKNGLRGCDRIVPVGKTMDLTFKWDGFDMIETMSRYIYAPNYLDTKKHP